MEELGERPEWEDSLMEDWDFNLFVFVCLAMDGWR
jgi:hypothetical protein